MGIEEENGTIKIRTVDVYFYGGIAGIAVFFRNMNQDCGLYGDVCERLEKMLFSYTDRVNNKEMNSITENPGMYCGEGYVVYAYQLLYKITEEKRYWDYADKHVNILMRCVRQEAPFDLLHGNAGAVLVLCQQYVDAGNIAYLSEAHKVLKCLDNRRIETEQGITWFEKAEGNPVCSMAHGNSGVLLAYARIQSLDVRANYSDRMQQIVKNEDQFYNEEYGNWADLRKRGEDRWKTYAWCNGGVGVAVARIQAAVWNPKNKDFLLDYKKVKRLVSGISEQGEMCLCHGNVGNYICLSRYLYYFDSGFAERKLRVNKGDLIEFLKKYDWGLSKSQGRYGFMDGMTGVGEVCLRLTTNLEIGSVTVNTC